MRTWVQSAGHLLGAFFVLGICLTVFPQEILGETVTLTIIVNNPSVPGCTDSHAANYNSAATIDNGSCTYPPPTTPNTTTNTNNNTSSNNSGGSVGANTSGPLLAFPSNTGTVTLQGVAYPGSQVSLTRDGQIIGRTQAGPDANFSYTISGVTPGTYTYGVWSTDNRGIRSVTHAFTIAVTQGVGTVISGIFMPPTIDIDKSEVKRGDILTLLGQAPPTSTVTLSIHSDNAITKRTTAGSNGIWKYQFNTSEVAYGNHTAAAQASLADTLSELSSTLPFVVGTKNVLTTKQPVMPLVDLNSDGKIDLKDFSIMAYWYKRPLTSTGRSADLNNDGKVDLKDFSILAYRWTG